jgi:hypothetical protein
MRGRWSVGRSGVVRRSGVAMVAALTALSGAVLGVLSGVGAVPAAAASPDSRAPIVTELVDTAGGVRVGFKDRSVDEDAFTLFRRGLSGSWEYVVETPTRDRPGQRAQGALVDPTPNALRCYAVVAYDNAGGVLLQSRSECLRGGFDPFDPLIARTTPRIAAPEVTHVQVLGQAGGSTQVRVRYVDRSTNESRFKLFRRSAPGDGNHAFLRETTSQRRTTVGQLLFFDDSVPTGTNPCYTVQALDEVTTLSNLSNELCLTPLPALPAPPPGQATNNIAYPASALGSTAVGADGLPIFSHTGARVVGDTRDSRSVFVTHCDDAACATATTTEVDRDTPSIAAGLEPSIAIGRDGRPIITYLGRDRVQRVAHCADRACTTATTATIPDPARPITGGQISIGSDGLATIAYWAQVGAGEVVLKVAHCLTVACPSLTVATIDTLGPADLIAPVGLASVTSPAGYTYIATAVFASPGAPPTAQGMVKVTTCFNPTCTSRTTQPVDWQLPGEKGSLHISIAVGRDNRPVLGYTPHGDLRFAQCVNILCTGVTTRLLDTMGQGSGTAIAVGGDGLPAIAYEPDPGDGPGIKFAHCTDPACRNASIVAVLEGEFASIAIGTDGLPVIGYNPRYRDGLGLLRCRDVLCSGGPFPGPTGPLAGSGGKCAEVLLASTDNGTPIQLRPCSGHEAQNWTVDTGGRLRALGKCLTVAGGATANGTPIQLHDCNGQLGQVWVSHDDGALRDQASGKCLDTASHSNVDFIRLVLWDCIPDTPSQRWRLPTS